jgi:hypothetical protein
MNAELRKPILGGRCVCGHDKSSFHYQRPNLYIYPAVGMAAWPLPLCYRRWLAAFAAVSWEKPRRRFY